MTTKHQLTWTEVKTALLLHVPFFASLLLDIMDVRVGKFTGVFPEGNETMATDGRLIYIDQDFLAGLSIKNGVFGVCHEVGHGMWEHMLRGKKYQELGFDGEKFDPILFNIAADYVINDMLVKSGVGEMLYDADGKPQWLLDPKYTCDMSVEEVYRDIKKNGMPPSAGKGKPGQGQPGQGKPGHGGMDTHIFSDTAMSPVEMKRAIQTAADTARACGSLPGALQRFAEQILDPQVSWRDLLRTVVVTAASRDTTSWARPHRRRLSGQGVYIARPAAYGCNCVVCIVDTSGSIGQAQLNVFFSELADIVRTCRPETIWVVGADTRVASEVELPGDVDISSNPPEVGGGGGTDFRPAFEWVREKGIEPDALVYFTDMEGPFPQEEPGYPVVWCSITPDREAPIGRTIYVDLK